MTKTVTTGKATDLITFTRSTTGTYLDSVKYGDELVTNGTFDDNIDGWTANEAILSHVDGALLIEDNGGWTSAVQQLSIVNGIRYILELDVLEKTSNCHLAFNTSATGTPTRVISYSLPLGRYRLEFEADDANYIYIGSSGTGSVKIDNITVKEVIGNQGTSGEPLLRTAFTNEPRIEYDADGNLKGLLIEEQRTNSVTQSEDLTTWSKASGGAVVANQAIAPDGTQTADEMVGVVYKAPNIGSSTRSFSVYLKAKAGTTAQVRIDVPASQRIIVDLTDGSVPFSTGSSLDSYGVVDVGNGWYRCHIVVTDSINNYVIVGEANDASHTIYAWGAQLETGKFPTSYIPTSGSTVTRNADVATISTGKFEYNENESCVLIEASFLGRDSGEYPRLLDFAQGVNTSSIWATSTAVNIDKSGVGAQATVLWDMTPSKIAASVTSGDIALVVNDSTVDTSTATLVTTSTQFTIGAAEGGTQRMSGHIKSIKYYPVRLTNNQLKALTQ